MEKTNFTFVQILSRTILSVLVVFTVLNQAQAQCTLACNDAVNISVDATPNNDCSVSVTADMLLENYESAIDDCAGGIESGFTLTIMNGPIVVSSGPSTLIMAGSEYNLNQVYTSKVQAGGNTCWGTVKFEDKASPVITGCDPITTPCTVNINDVPTPIANDNCSGATVQLIDENVVTADQCNTGVVVTRTYVAVDTEGNVSAPCTQEITIETVDGVDFPEDIAFSCAQYANNNNITNPTALTCTGLVPNPAFSNSLDATVAPASCIATTGAGMPSVALGTYCTFATSSHDEMVSTCGDNPNTFKIIRTWTAINWCGNQVVTFNDANANGVQDADEEDNIQVIVVMDSAAPTLTFEPSTSFEVSANLAATATQACRSRAALPVPTVTDACSATTLSIYTPVGPATLVNGLYIIPAPGLPMGTHTINYVAADQCGNIEELSADITVVDNIAPTPVCDEITQISISGAGSAIVYASTFDDGSTDNCGIAAYDVRRMTDNCDITGNTTYDSLDDPADTDNGDYISFCCADVGTTVDVILRVTDYEGNSNECMVQVLVEDKLDPYLVSGLNNASITCEDYYNNYAGSIDIAQANNEINPAVLSDEFGNPVYMDNCEVIVTSSYTRNVNSCGVGTIVRTFNAIDAQGNQGPTVSQTIDVTHVNDWEIEFPENVDLVCLPGQDELAGQNFGEPEVFNDNCEMIAISVEDTRYDVVPDACYKILRTYTAINWCVFDGSVDNDNNLVSTRRYHDGGDGHIAYTQVIKVTDEEAPVIANPGDKEYAIDGITDPDGDCDRNIILPEAAVTDCSEDITVTYVVEGLGTGRNHLDVSPGDYPVIVTATDNCGNQTQMTYTVSVVDRKAPTPYCIGGLVVELMPVDTDGNGVIDGGMVETWASDFNAGSFDNCTPAASLLLTANVTTNDFAASTPNLLLDCSHSGINNVFLYVQDASGNVDVCQTTLTVESVDSQLCNGENEDPSLGNLDDPQITGALHTENNVALAGANVEVNSGAMNMATTDDNGAYSVAVNNGADVTVAPSYEASYVAGVSTFDLVLIRKHILNTELLDSPYKQIAADVNNSGNITASDLVALKATILGINTSFANNTSWVFVDASYTFPADWTLADSYPAVVNVNNIDADLQANFMAIKVGDVNGSWDLTGSSEERNANTLIINANNAILAAGEEFTVNFTAEDFAAIGYQFTMNFTDLELVNIDGNTEDFGVFADAITTSWNGEATTDKLFSVTFRALSDLTVSEALTLTSKITKAEAYDANGEEMSVELIFNETPSTEFALYQNKPNPVVNGNTIIGFDLPTTTAATLTISDISGKVIAQISGNYSKGYNEVEFTNIDAKGVMTYTLESADYTATRKFVVL